SIGKKLFKDDFKRRMKMFDSLVENIALYGAEKIRKVDFRIGLKDTKLAKKKLIQECIKDLEKKRLLKEEDNWEKIKRKILERAGNRLGRKNQDRSISEDLVKKIENKEKKDRRVKINESRYNCNYKNITTDKLLKYLKGKRKWKDRSLIAVDTDVEMRRRGASTGERSKTGVAEYA
ncbi:hypothetical protein ALC56_04633, partial [Trachymyrmex septentrionalis]